MTPNPQCHEMHFLAPVRYNNGGYVLCGSEYPMDLLVKHIEKTPGVCGGRACIAGHRIRVQDIVAWHERRGYSPDEIVDLFPGITLADVYAALAYYFDNRQEIDDEFRKSDEWAQWVTTNVPSKIPAQLRGNRGVALSGL
jgi:uncharacterized protein (DUF433 family)